MKSIELLAPAKNLKCGMAAIDSGADAVYIGGPSFGARINVPNTIDDIACLTDYAHQFGARIHVALNTILNDSELEEARDLSFKLYDIGVDALIIQDLGLINGPLPPIELHASTQQDNSSPEKIKFLEEIGFSQAVLARELSLNDIREIKKQAGSIKLEAFVHGALCVGMSGRCYLSAAITGRSANRGECAQLCRVAQNLFDKDGRPLATNKFLLSLKDLNQTRNLKELIDAGISSFKIEGRLKDDGYVRNVTAWYRRHLDAVIDADPELCRSSFGTVKTTFTPDVAKSFNRGFTEYNTHEVKDNYANFNAPGFVGEKIGKLRGVKGHVLEFDLFRNIELHNGDSLNYYRSDAELTGFRISKVVDGTKAEIFQDLPFIRPGTVFYRSKDADFEKTLTDSSSIRTMELHLSYSESDTGVTLSGYDEMTAGQPVSVTLPLPEYNPANDREKLKENITGKIGRLGNTCYRLAELDLNLSRYYFVPQSILNELRRTFITALEKRKKELMVKVTDHSGMLKNSTPLTQEEKRLGFKANIFNSLAEEFYIKHGAECTIPAYERDKGNEPREVLVSKHCLHYCFGLCPLRHHAARQPLYLQIGRTFFEVRNNCARCRMSLIGPIPRPACIK